MEITDQAPQRPGWWSAPLAPVIFGDPDGLLVPLPTKPEPVRVPPPFPLTAYQVMVRLNG